jgi:hypothetical protein
VDGAQGHARANFSRCPKEWQAEIRKRRKNKEKEIKENGTFSAPIDQQKRRIRRRSQWLTSQ